MNRLPRARLISFRWQRHWMGRFFLKTRGANFAAIWLGPLQIAWRMPWLPDAAMRLQTHLFKHNRPEPTGLARWWRR